MSNQTITQPPSEQKLKLFLAQGIEYVGMVQQMIDAHKLPFIIEVKGNVAELKDALKGTDLQLNKFITVDPVMVKRKGDIPRLAKCEYPVLICGESGTGKEIIARAMIGERKGYTMFINCAGLPETLMESELFGYIKGSFTGAMGDRQGMLARAKDGVAFLDEISWLTLPMQAKLLRAIQEKTVRRVGSYEEEEINCKIVCASNRNLKELVSKGLFLEDLYARIRTFEFDITPLRDRLCDVHPIIKSLKFGEEFLNELRKTGKNVGNLNLEYNVRSLQAYVHRFEVYGRLVL